MKRRLILGAWPLLIYPFVALASVMSLFGHATGKEPILLLTVARGFQIGSLVYPVVYVGCLITALVVRKKKEALAAKIALLPLWFLGVVCVLFGAWVALEG